MDVDIAIQVSPEDAERLVASFGEEFYVPADAALEAVDEHGSFNVLDTTSGLKVNLFVLGDAELDLMQIERRVAVSIPGLTRAIWVTAPEVQVLRKLEWFVRGGEVSDRQWRDIVSILRINRTLDREFLTDAAGTLGLAQHLALALRQAETPT